MGAAKVKNKNEKLCEIEEEKRGQRFDITCPVLSLTCYTTRVLN